MDNNRYRYEEEKENKNSENESKENKSEKVEKENTKPNEEKTTVNENNNSSEESKKEKKDKYNKKLDELKAENEALKQQIANLKNDVLKAKAEEINFKNRIEAERDRTLKYANQSVLEKFVTHIDLFDKVVSMPTDDPTLKNYLIGFQMIDNNFKQTLEEEGVKKIVVKEKVDKVDPKFHHALQTECVEDLEDDVIIQVLQNGYMYKDRVLRPALVKVNKKEKKEGK